MEKQRWAIYGMVGVLLASLLGAMGAVGAREALTVQASAPRLNDAPYRDGLFQGKLAAERGRVRDTNALSRGRWSEEEKRAHFVMGYKEGVQRDVPARIALRHPVEPFLRRLSLRSRSWLSIPALDQSGLPSAPSATRSTVPSRTRAGRLRRGRSTEGRRRHRLSNTTDPRCA